MLSANQITRFSSQLYLNSNWVNKLDNMHAEINWREVKGTSKVFTRPESKILSANQIEEFLKQLYLKNDGVNQPYILHVDKDSREVNVDLRNFLDS